MSDTSIQFRVDDVGTQELFARLLALSSDQSGPMNGAADALEARIRQTFIDQADPWGNPWPALKDATIKARERRGESRKSILFDTGAMYSSIVRESGATEATVRMGAEGSWPVVHQFGLAEKNIPARPMFPIDRYGNAVLEGPWADEIRAPFEQALRDAAE